MSEIMKRWGEWYGECRKHGRYLWHPHGSRVLRRTGREERWVVAR